MNSYGKLFLVDNPEHNSKGDYAIKDGMLSLDGDKLTFSGIAIYSPIAFKDIPIEKLKLKPYFDKWISENKLFAEKGCFCFQKCNFYHSEVQLYCGNNRATLALLTD